jgi:hypothetical protein
MARESMVDRSTNRRLGAAQISACTLLLVIVTVLAYFRPFFFPDVVPYAAAVMSTDEHNPQVIHEAVKRQLISEIGQKEYQSLLADPSPWWSAMMGSPQGLLEELPFYTNRPLYVATTRLLVRHTSLDAFHALHLVSALSLLPIGMTLLFWTRQPMAAALLLLTPTVLFVGRIATPDALSTALVISGLYFLYRKRNWWACALLILGIYARPDNLVITGLVLLWLVYRHEMPLHYGALLSSLALISFFLVKRMSGFFGWAAVFLNTLTAVPFPAHHVFHLTLRDYAAGLLLGIRSVCTSTEIAIWVLIGILAIKRLGMENRSIQLLALVGGSIAIRFLLFPFPQDRYFLPLYLVAGATLASTFKLNRFEPMTGHEFSNG